MVSVVDDNVGVVVETCGYVLIVLVVDSVVNFWVVYLVCMIC